MIKKCIAYLSDFYSINKFEKAINYCILRQIPLKLLTRMNLLVLTSLILLHNNVCIHNGIEKRAENMFELCWLLHFVTSIIAGESSFSTDDNHDSTVVAFAIAPASALDLDRRREIYGASGTSMHFPRMSEINCARVCRSWKGKEGFRRRELWGERVRRRRVRARLQKVASDEITIPDTSLSLAATDRWD